MLKFRTTKEVGVSVHDDSKGIVEFTYHYKRPDADTFVVRVDAYAVDGDTLALIPQGCKTENLTGDNLSNLIAMAKQATTPSNEPLDYMDALIANGIKIVLTSGGYWKNVLTMEDFE